jgi:hypothetical protein
LSIWKEKNSQALPRCWTSSSVFKDNGAGRIVSCSVRFND